MQARILENGVVRATTRPDDVASAHDAGLVVWVELEERTPELDRLLSETFKVHALTIEDIWASRLLPKLEDFDGYLYILVHALEHSSSARDPKPLELDILLSPTFVITHDSSGCVAEQVQANSERLVRSLAKGTGWLVHAIVDLVVDRYLPLLDEFDNQIEVLEKEVVQKAGTPEGTPVLERIFAIKRSLQALRRFTIHQREILLRLSRREFDEIPVEAAPFFRDVYDHFVRVTDLAESYRELASGALEAYLSVQSNRMNEIMKTLTLVSTVMLPLTFIAGVYGMNFKRMPELDWVYGYPYALGLMVVVGTGFAVWFRRKRWL